MAAGKGTRMGLPEGVNKCSIPLSRNKYDTTINRLIKQFDQEVNVVVVGYGAESVINSISPDYLGGDSSKKVHIVHNPLSEICGSGYTLYCAKELINNYCITGDEPCCYFAEGDSMYSDEIVDEFCYKTSSSVLIRSPRYLSSRSVAVLERDRRVLSMIYDTSHQFNFQELSKINCNDRIEVYESMQLWKICGDQAKKTFIDNLTNNPYSTNLSPFLDLIPEGLLETHYMSNDCSERWINLNTKEDVKTAKQLIKEGKL